MWDTVVLVDRQYSTVFSRFNAHNYAEIAIVRKKDSLQATVYAKLNVTQSVKKDLIAFEIIKFANS